MKRSKVYQPRLIKFKNRTYWPMIYCLGEDRPIGISKTPWKRNEKVTVEHWYSWQCQFLSPEHTIDMIRYKVGDKVICPKCGGDVDFRLWMSDTEPSIII